MAGPSDPGVPAARWKRHIVRQLRQRDRTQKALFLELVPACECSASRGRRGDRAPARGRICLAPPAVTQVTDTFSPPKPGACWTCCLLRAISD